MLNGFKEFIARGNAVDLAVGLVIGAAFGAVVTSIVDNLITPLIAAIFGKPDLSHVLAFKLNGADFSLGAILTAIINFLLVALAVYFCVVLPLNKLAERRKKDEPAIDEDVSPTEIELLVEIRDALREQRS
jgi:large conductance mechanosensitive channel